MPTPYVRLAPGSVLDEPAAAAARGPAGPRPVVSDLASPDIASPDLASPDLAGLGTPDPGGAGSRRTDAHVDLPDGSSVAPAGMVVLEPADTRRVVAGPRRTLAASALLILAALLLGFVVDIALVGRLGHARDQQVAYAQLRQQLAEGTAPVGQTGADGVLLPLGAPVALLEVPSIGLRETVLEGTTSGVLARGAGHRRDTVLPGQPGTAVLFGRRAAYGGPFHRISALRPGAVVSVTTGQGVAQYQVRDVRHAGDPFPPALPPGAGRLVLTTADGAPFLPSGVTRVDAELTSPGMPAPGRSFGVASLPASESALAGDPGVLFVLLLWVQALVVAVLALTWARLRWGRWQSWVVGVPLLGALGVAVADSVAQLLPNLL